MASYGYGALIGGAWRAEGAARFETRNPAAPRETVGDYAVSTAADIADAVAAARAAQRE